MKNNPFGFFHRFQRGKNQPVHRDYGLLLSAQTPFAIKEAYKSARTNLLFALATDHNKCIVVTSSQTLEGKSTNCANLAMTMAQTQASVLVIDADLRKSTQHKIFNLKNKVGLADILGGFCAAEDGIQREVAPNLDVITAGRIPPNPSELLGSSNMQHLLEALREKYDYIFIDSPPINVVTDALVVAKYAAGLVFCARCRQSTHDDLRRAFANIEFAGIKILGILLCDVREEYTGYYRKHYYRSYYKRHYQEDCQE